jgi:two-component system, response regulator
MRQTPVDILLIEDNPDDAELTLHALRKAKLANQIHLLRDGAEAIEFFFGPNAAESRPRVILLDLKLPKVSGLEVLKRLKADARTSKVPVVVMTSSREDRDVEEAYKLGVNSYVVKPVEFEGFTQAVCNLGLYWLVLNTPPA